jgi:quinol monooxygenase YgiN
MYPEPGGRVNEQDACRAALTYVFAAHIVGLAGRTGPHHGRTQMGTLFTSTDWRVKDGMHGAFVERWTSFLKWSRETQDGLGTASLVADEEDPGHYLSLGEWRDSAARQAWQDEPRFMEFFLPCLELCDDMQSKSFEIKVTI